MKIPNSASMGPENKQEFIPEMRDVILNNPYFGNKELTRMQALDLINQLSMQLLIDEKER